jgi:tetratricopeptide (TPR) repeat protein/GTPase SAR1 family protein
MGNELKLAKKTYYQSLILLDQHTILTLKQLSEMLSSAADSVQVNELRFIQGEIYFLFGDYESSIFKWMKVEGSLSEWAKKNIGDAYVKLNQFANAEVSFKSVQPKTKELSLEKLLALFSLYKRGMHQNLAIEAIEDALKIDPDYQQLSRMAQAYYEEIGSYEKAVKLTVYEYGRTKDSYWMQAINGYIESGIAEKVEPRYFFPMLPVLVYEESSVFHTFIISLWNRYEQTTLYMDWLEGLNSWFDLNHETITENFIHEELLDYLESAFLHLTTGRYLLEDISDLVPDILVNSYYLLEKSNSYRHTICAAIVAWSEWVPGTLPKEIVEKSRKQVLGNKLSDLKNELKNNMYHWATEKNFSIDPLIDWWIQYFHDDQNVHLLIAGTFSNGKSSFINSILGEEILLTKDLPTTSTLIHLHFGKDTQFHRISEKEIEPFSKLEQLQAFTTIDHDHEEKQIEGIVDVALPSKFLEDKNVTFIDSPGFNDIRKDENPTKDFINLADAVLFVLSAEAPFRKTERDIMFELLEADSLLDVDFLLNKLDYIEEEEELEEVLDDVSRKIKKHFGNAVLIPYSSREPESYLESFGQFLQGKSDTLRNSEGLFLGRSRKVIPWYNQLLDSFEREKEKAISRLKGMVEEQQDQIKLLQSIQEEVYKSKDELLGWIKSQYEVRKDRLIRDIQVKVPKTIKNCSSLVHVDSDFKNLHHLLNEEMNREMERLLKYEILPNYQNGLEEWLDNCKMRLSSITAQKEQIEQILSFIFEGVKLDINVETIDRLLDHQRLKQAQIIGTFAFEPRDIMLKLNVKKALLIGAGRIFGKLNNSNTILYDQYKKYLETETFDDAAKECLDMILKQFPAFDAPILSELDTLFTTVTESLGRFISTIKKELNDNETELTEFFSNPELIDDPITLFRVSVRRQELLQEANSSVTAPILTETF